LDKAKKAVLHSQVLIGSYQSDMLPQEYSVLELISNGNKGLRLPQLTGSQFQAMNLKLSDMEAKGLTVFNMDTNCVEVWEGKQWNSICAPQPVVTSSPASKQVADGEAFTLTVWVSGMAGRPTYQWYKDETKIAGATNSTYTVSSAAQADAGGYSCEVINSYGTVISSAVHVSVS